MKISPADLNVGTLALVAARTATLTGTGVDISAYVGSLKIIQTIGTVSGTNPTWDGKIQDSADNSTGWADVTGATFTQATAADGVQAISVDTRACKKYIRYVGTIGGTSTPTFTGGVHFVGGKATQS